MTQEDKERGYKETKEFICTGCGKTIVLTKFASQKTCKCEECKANNVPINQDIVAQALAKNPPKPRKNVNGNISGDTKECACIKCGKMVTVTKFASAAKVLCPDCKGTPIPSRSNGDAPHLKPDMSKLDRSKILEMEEYELNDGVIKNGRLRHVQCPACGHEYMKPLMIIDWSQFGMIIDYQCQECYTKVTLSEQCRQRMKHYNPGRQFDYTGREIKELGIHWKDSSRMANMLCTLIHICEENNINIDDEMKDFHESIPPYKYLNDRPVPAGFVIPPVDRWVSIVDNVIKAIENAERVDDNVQISTEQATQLADKLKSLLKEDADDQHGNKEN